MGACSSKITKSNITNKESNISNKESSISNKESSISNKQSGTSMSGHKPTDYPEVLDALQERQQDIDFQVGRIINHFSDEIRKSRIGQAIIHEEDYSGEALEQFKSYLTQNKFHFFRSSGLSGDLDLVVDIPNVTNWRRD